MIRNSLVFGIMSAAVISLTASGLLLWLILLWFIRMVAEPIVTILKLL